MPATPTLTTSDPIRPTASRTPAPTGRAQPPVAGPPADVECPQGPRVQNRVRVLLTHIPMFSVQGQARLAARAGVSRSTVSRLVRGRISPSYHLARAVTAALERQIGYPLDMRDVFTTDGTYPTPSGCALCRCRGCLPEEAYDAEGDLRPEWRGQRPGDWSLARPLELPPALREHAIKEEDEKNNVTRKEGR